MKIQVNGESHQFDRNLTAMDLIKRLGLAERRLALEVNGEIVRRSLYGEHQLKDGDKIEIVHAVGGG